MRCRNRGKRHNDSNGWLFAAFGIGLLACTILPSKLMVVLLAAALILCGVSCGKR